MGKNEKIGIKSVDKFELEMSEIRRLYLTLSLLHFPSLRSRDYDEETLLRRLLDLFKKTLAALTKQAMESPNDLHVYKLRLFFDMHYNIIRGVVHGDNS